MNLPAQNNHITCGSSRHGVIAENNLLFERSLTELSSDCELCGKHPAEHFMETPWGERHICTQCAESLPENNHYQDS